MTRIIFGSGNPGSIQSGNSGGRVELTDSTVNITGTGLNSYQRASMAGYAGTDGEFYTALAQLASGETPIFSRHVMGSTSAAVGERIRMQIGGSVGLPMAGTDDQILISAAGGDVTVTPNGADTIQGGSSFTIPDGSTFVLTYGAGDWDVTNWGAEDGRFMKQPLVP